MPRYRMWNFCFLPVIRTQLLGFNSVKAGAKKLREKALLDQAINEVPPSFIFRNQEKCCLYMKLNLTQ